MRVLALASQKGGSGKTTLSGHLAVEETITLQIGQRAAANPEEIGAAAYDYLMYSGYVTLAYWWARSVAAADASSQPQAFKDAKRETARFYYARLLPRTLSNAAAIRAGADSLMAMDAARFDA